MYLMGSTCRKGYGRFCGVFTPIGWNGVFLTEMYLTRAWYFGTDGISIQTIYHWKHLFIGFLKK